MDEKVKVTIELSKNDIIGVAYFIGVDNPEELWGKMKSQTFTYPLEQLEENERKTLTATMAAVAVGMKLKQAGMWK